MRKRYIASAVGVASAGVASYFLRNKDNRDKLKEQAKSVTGMGKSEQDLQETLQEAGVPDQVEDADRDVAQLENAKMVSEGSQFGVEYYNEVKERAEKKAEQRSE